MTFSNTADRRLENKKKIYQDSGGIFALDSR